MKKVWKQLVCSVACTAMVTGLVSVAGVAEADGTNKEVTVRIEGISQNLYYDTLEVPDEDGTLTAADALLYADAQSDAITITGIAEGYITQVNDDVAGTYGGWDGWLFLVNGASPSVGIGDCVLNDGDEVVLYYGDPYGVGMQYPEMNLFNLEAGVVTFTSQDTTYDASGNPSTQTNPVTDMTVTVGASTYVTDAAGSITLSDADVQALPQGVQVEKKAENGCPLVLRLAPDTTLEAAGDAGDSLQGAVVLCSLMMLLSAGAVCVLKKRNA